MFYRKPGKLAATTIDVWVNILTRRRYADPAREVAAMIVDGRLVLSPE